MNNRLKFNRNLIYILSFLCLFVLIFSFGGSKATNVDKNASLSELQDEKDKIEDKISELEKNKNNVFEYVKQIDGMLTSSNKKLKDVNDQLMAKEADIKKTEEELVIAKEEEKKQYEAMKLRIRYVYESGGIDYIELILKADSIADAINKSEYVKEVAEYDKKLMNSLVEIRNEIVYKEVKLKQEYTQLETLKAEVQKEKEINEKLLSSKTKELDNLAKQLDQQEKNLQAYNQAIKEEEEEIARQEAAAAAAAAANGGTVEYTGGALLWPVPGHSRISSYFGEREQPVPGASTNHKGIDIPAPVGTAIVAAEAGTVSISQYSSSAGNYIMINHGGGLSTVYMHCSQLLVDVGETVSRGQKIALVGSTGYSSGPHLHFGVRINGNYVNPLNYLN